MPIGEIGGSKVQGRQIREGYHPDCTSEARKFGETRSGGEALPLHYAWGSAPSLSVSGVELKARRGWIFRARDRHRMAETTGSVKRKLIEPGATAVSAVAC